MKLNKLGLGSIILAGFTAATGAMHYLHDKKVFEDMHLTMPSKQGDLVITLMTAEVDGQSRDEIIANPANDSTFPRNWKYPMYDGGMGHAYAFSSEATKAQIQTMNETGMKTDILNAACQIADRASDPDFATRDLGTPARLDRFSNTYCNKAPVFKP